LKRLLLSSLIFATVGANASVFVSQPLSTTIVKGQSINQSDIGTVIGNPANGHFMISDDATSKWRMGALGSINVGAEFGDVESLDTELDAFSLALDLNNLTLAEAQSEVERFNKLLSKTDAAFVRVGGVIEAPIMPLVYKTEIGTFSFDLTAGAFAKGSVINSGVTTTVDFGGGNFGIDADAGTYVQSAEVIQLGLGYSRGIYKNDFGALSGGVKINVIDMNLRRTVIGVNNINDANDVLTDGDLGEEVSSTEIGVDVGATWVTDRYTAGLVIKNINEPEFDLPTLGGDCSSLAGSALDSCNAANTLVGGGQFALSDKYTAEAQATIDTSYMINADGRFALNASYDMSSIQDPLGDEYQWANVGLSYAADSSWIPGARIGFRTNMAGSELSYITAGVSLFRYINLDLGVSNESVQYDGSDVPRGLFANLTLRKTF
jgi:hypothetical protein